MVEKLEHYADVAKRMIEDDNKRNQDFQIYENMYHAEWNLPPEMTELQWMRKEVSSDPHDAVDAAIKTLTSKQPSITYLPLASNIQTKKRANDCERNLEWQLMSINRRRQATV